MSLDGKHIVVTGGGTGVGADTARALADAGATVTIMGRRPEPLKQQSLPFEICDVTDRDAVAAAFESASATSGPIAGVIANAGAAESAPFARMTPEHLQSMLAVNLVGVVNVWQAALPEMKKSGWGRLVAIASVTGLKGFPYVSAYCAAKHGVIGLMRALALEVAETGITVNAICPGYIDTPMLDRSVANIVAKTGMTEDDARANLRDHNPQKRFIESGEVAAAALWLCGEAARSVNGHALSLSGGEV